jgi:hypothetical protein
VLAGRNVKAPLWTLFALSSWDHTATVAKQVTTLLWPLFARSSWAQTITVEAATTGESAALASVSLVGVGLTSHYVGGHDS